MPRTLSVSFRSWFKKHWLVLLLLALPVLINYLPFINNDFLSDDLPGIKNDPNIGNLSYIFSHPIGMIRPLLDYFVYQIGGMNPPSFRILNILFHLGDVWVIYALICLLYGGAMAFVVAIIFAVHPVLSEAVVWISAEPYVQYSFFFLVSLLFYILKDSKKRYYILSLIFFFLTLMSHGVAVGLVSIFFLYEISLGNIKKNWLKLLPFFILTGVWLILGTSVVQNRVNTLKTVNYQDPGIENPFYVMPVALSGYLTLIFMPVELTLYHSELRFNIITYCLSILTLIGFIAALIYSYIKKRDLFFWLGFFALSLGGSVLASIFRLTWIVGERYVYLSTLGVIVAVCLILSRFIKNTHIRPLMICLLTLIVVTFSVRTIIRNIEWENEDNLWLATGRTSPSSPNTHNNLGDVYGRHGDRQRAAQEFMTAIALKPNYADAYHNLGNTYQEMGDQDKALESYKKAAELNPYLWQSFQNIAAIYYGKGQYDLAEENLQKALTVFPTNSNLWVNLGIVYLKANDKTKATQAFNQALQVNPNDDRARLGVVEAAKP